MLCILQKLRQFRVNIREFTDANGEANKFKNRLANALPCEPHYTINMGVQLCKFLRYYLSAITHSYTDNYNRVYLTPVPGVNGSDYINASFIDVSSWMQVQHHNNGHIYLVRIVDTRHILQSPDI